MITGNTTFSNNTVTVFFGNALDNLPGDVWIRIVTLNPSAGVQSRPTTAIDDVLLAWTLTVPDYRPSITALSPPDNSTHVALSSNLVLNFDRQVQKGTGDIHIVNEVSQMLQGIPVNSPDVAISGNTVTVSAISWIPGTPYHVLIDSTAFDTAGYRFPGIYNITDWNFITAPVAAGFLNENFDTACAYNNLPSGWSRHNITGPDQEWSCGGTVDKYMYMNGFSATSNSNDNEDWLITPELDFTNANNPSLHFRTYRGFTGKPLQVYYSTGYPGTGNPNAVSWHNLNINFSNDTTAWTGHSANLPLQQLYIAFKYTCTQAANDCAQWRVDSVVVTEATGVLPVEPDNRMPLTVHGLSTGSHIELGFVAAESGLYTAYVYGLSGREVYRAALSAVKGDNRIVLRPSSLSTGVFIICVSGKTDYGVTKVVVQ